MGSTPMSISVVAARTGVGANVLPPIAASEVTIHRRLDVTALHNHGLMDTPRLFYMHFWATGDPVTLAQGLTAALDATNSAKPASPDKPTDDRQGDPRCSGSLVPEAMSTESPAPG